MAEKIPSANRPMTIIKSFSGFVNESTFRKEEGPMATIDADRAMYETKIAFRPILIKHALIQLPAVNPMPQTKRK